MRSTKKIILSFSFTDLSKIGAKRKNVKGVKLSEKGKGSEG